MKENGYNVSIRQYAQIKKILILFQKLTKIQTTN